MGHPTELDRVLGYEANYAGTSFLTLDKWQSKKFNFGSKLVNIKADKIQKGSLGAVGYDDEGVATVGPKLELLHLVESLPPIAEEPGHPPAAIEGRAQVELRRIFG